MRNNDECCAAKAPSYGDECRPEQPMMGGMAPEYAYFSRAKAREIHIQPMDYGFLVRVGCQSFVFETAEKMIANLNAYLKDPESVEKSWVTGYLTL